MWRVTRGTRDSSNRSSLWFEDALPVVGRRAEPLPVPDDADRAHVQGRSPDRRDRRRHQHEHDALGDRQPERAGHARHAHQQGDAADRGRLRGAGRGRAPSPIRPRPVGGTVPATLSLTLGAPAAFGAFTPGIAKDYTASMTATVISTAGDATLTVADPSATATGPPGQRHVRPAAAAAGPRRRSRRWNAPRPPTTSRTRSRFKQIDRRPTNALRTGTYSKTLTFTLTTTTTTAVRLSAHRGLPTPPVGSYPHRRSRVPALVVQAAAARVDLRSMLAATPLPRPTSALRLPFSPRARAQIGLFLLAYLVYSAARFVTIGDLPSAQDHARLDRRPRALDRHRRRGLGAGRVRPARG